MRLIFLAVLGCLFLSLQGVATLPTQSATTTATTKLTASKSLSITEYLQDQYQAMNLEDKISFEAFTMAMLGKDHIAAKNDSILTIVDFSKPSTEKRMVVLNINKQQVLFHTIVSHGKNSGENYATRFSNKHGSYQSSPGFYITENTYQGGNGYSLVINGLEKNINDQAKARAVVIHGADYCSEKSIQSMGRLGRSYGCPALPRALNAPIINTIKEGSVLYIHTTERSYINHSDYIAQINSRLNENWAQNLL